MSKKQVFDLNNPQDIDELNRLIFDDDADDNVTLDEDFIIESEESETEDHLETRSIDSDTDHEAEFVEEEEVQSDNFYNGKSK